MTCTDGVFGTYRVAQQARNLLIDLGDHVASFRCLTRDRDSKFTNVVDDVFASKGIPLLRTPAQAPQTNAITKRWIGTLRRELLDKMLILNRPPPTRTEPTT